jgi:hypothetical protein
MCQFRIWTPIWHRHTQESAREEGAHTHGRVAGRGRTDTIASSKRRKVSEDMAAPSNVESDDYYKVCAWMSSSPPTHTQTAFFWCDASVRALGCARVICDTEPDRVAVALLLLQRDRKSVYGKVQMTRLVHICLCAVALVYLLNCNERREKDRRERTSVCVGCASRA